MWTGDSAPASGRREARAGTCCWLASLVLLASCSQQMANQPKYVPLRPSSFFDDGNSARSLVEGTVARGQLRDDPLLYTGRSAAAPGAAAAEESQVRRSVLAPPGSSPALPAAPPAGGQTAGGFSPEFPFPVTREVLERGEERFNIFCAVCHDRAGTGNGMIVQRGYRHPPSYHTDRLRQAPVGYIFDVITHGFGAMPDYASQIPPRDRWAIVAHIRVLQLSQNARLEDLPAEAKRQLQSGGRK